jgi:hypothetical protein
MPVAIRRRAMNAPNHSLTIAAVMLAVFLAGCDMLIYDDLGPNGAYSDGDFEYAIHRGAVLTRLGRNPFDISGARFRDLMLDNMRGNNRVGIPADFVTRASDRTIEIYKVVAVFNLAVGVDDSDLCQGADAVTIAPSPETIRLHMAFCMGDLLLSSGWGTARGITGPDDPRLATLIRRVTYAMIPKYGLEGDDGRIFIP